MKLYEYILRAKDEFSGTFKKLADVAGIGSSKTDDLNKKLGQTDDKAKKLNNTFSDLKKTIATVLTVSAISAFGADLVQTTARMEGYSNAITFAAGSARQGAKDIEFLKKTSNELGISLESSLKGYKTIAGATIGTNLKPQTQRIFKSVAMGAAAMGLSGDQTEGALLALGQMISKGKVQAEELRGQLGERIPGAFQIAARAMNMTTGELDKFMQKGLLTADVFLPRFAAEMERTFASAIPTASQSTQAALNRMNDGFLLFKERIGKDLRGEMVGTMNTIRMLTDALGDNLEILKAVAVGIGSVFIAFQGYSAIAALIAAINPLTASLMALAAAIGLVYYQYQKMAALEKEQKNAYRNQAYIDEKKQIEELVKIYEKKFGLDEKAAKLRAIRVERNTNENLLSSLRQEIKDAETIYAFNERTAKITKLSRLIGGVKMRLKAIDDEEQSYKESTAAVNTPAVSKGIKEVIGGGNRSVNVNVNGVKFAENINVDMANKQEWEGLEKQFREFFARVINGGVYGATQ